MGSKQKGRFTEPLLPDKTIAEQDGVSIKHYYRSGDHSPAHAHITGNGPSTRIGPKGHPLEGDPFLSSEQQGVVEQNLEEIRRAINKIGRWLWHNAAILILAYNRLSSLLRRTANQTVREHSGPLPRLLWRRRATGSTACGTFCAKQRIAGYNELPDEAEEGEND